MPAFPPWTDCRSLSVEMLACPLWSRVAVSLLPPCKAYVGMIWPIGWTNESELGAKAFDLSIFNFIYLFFRRLEHSSFYRPTKLLKGA